MYFIAPCKIPKYTNIQILKHRKLYSLLHNVQLQEMIAVSEPNVDLKVPCPKNSIFFAIKTKVLVNIWY